MRYLIEFSYNGSDFFGYQIQPNQISVQEELEKALSILLKEKIKITGAGRTDTRVHAKKMFAHFDISSEIDLSLSKKLNSFLPPSISIKNILPVSSNLHARFSATCRTYEYYISLVKDPFSREFTWQYWKRNLDLVKMNEASEILFQYDDFTSFSKLHTDNKTNICKIYKASWERNEHILKFTISADRFLRNMVRSIVGTMEQIGSEKINPEDLHQIIKNKNRNSAGFSAPAQGLFLVDVSYPEELFNIFD